MEEKEEIIVGLDIGTTKVVAIAGKQNQFGKIEILGMGRADSTGVMRGVVANINKTVEAIQKAVRMAEDHADIDIASVYVGIAGQHIKCVQSRGSLVRENGTDEVIDESDLTKLMSDMYKLNIDPGDRIIHVLPQEFTIDNELGIKDPIGMSGNRIEANFHIVTGQIAAAKNIQRCVEGANLQVADMILEPLASAQSALSDEEKEAGIALVDIGGGTTDLAIFHNGLIRHTAVIPFGGNIVTEDIKEGCSVMRRQAEQLKLKFGSALALKSMENQMISISGLKGRKHKEVSVKMLSSIIQSRMEEIIEEVLHEIKVSGYIDRLIGGIAITGGGSQLKNLNQLVEYLTGFDCRIGYPTEHLTRGVKEELMHPMYATSIGLILKGFRDLENNMDDIKVDNFQKMRKQNTVGWFSKMFEKSKKWFVDEEVNNFK